MKIFRKNQQNDTFWLIFIQKVINYLWNSSVLLPRHKPKRHCKKNNRSLALFLCYNWFYTPKNIHKKSGEWYILIYLSYNNSLNICKTLQNYSQGINYYKTVKKDHKKVIKNFHHFITFTLPLYGNQMNRTSLNNGTKVKPWRSTRLCK